MIFHVHIPQQHIKFAHFHQDIIWLFWSQIACSCSPKSSVEKKGTENSHYKPNLPQNCPTRQRTGFLSFLTWLPPPCFSYSFLQDDVLTVWTVTLQDRGFQNLNKDYTTAPQYNKVYGTFIFDIAAFTQVQEIFWKHLQKSSWSTSFQITSYSKNPP